MFDGLGTEIIVFVLGLLFGGGAGCAITYRITKNKYVSKTVDNSETTNRGIKTGGGDYTGRDRHG